MAKVKPPVTLEPPPAELLFLATGPTGLPDKTARAAAKTIWKTLTDLLVAAIDLEEPGHLYAPGIPDSYWSRLQRFDPPYGEIIEELPDVGAAWQAMQMKA